MTIRLKVTTGNENGQEFEFERARISVGRGPLNTIALDDESAPSSVGDFKQDADGTVRFICAEADGRTWHTRDGLETRSDARSEWEVVAGDQISTGDSVIHVDAVATEDHADLHWLELPHLEAKLGATEKALVEVVEAAAADASAGTVLRAVDHLLKGRAQKISLTFFQPDKGQYRREAFVLRHDGDHDGQVTPCVDPMRRLGTVGLRLAREHQNEAGKYAMVKHENATEVFVPLHNPTDAALLGFTFIDGTSEDLRDAAIVAQEVQPIAAIVLEQIRLRDQVASLEAENAYFRERERRHYLFKELIVESESMRAAYQRLTDIVDMNGPLLIVGEAGSGKELMARAVHHLGKRKSQMMISLNCGSLTGPELDVELFGSISNGLTGASSPRKGVFELAEDGTVYLEEIDLLSPLLQGKILRMLTENEIRRVGDSVGRPVSCRLVCSLHRELESVVTNGGLRRDLYLNLKDHTIEVPALRDREEDIMPLARIFMRNFANRYGKTCHRIHPDVQAEFLRYTWPGNARELQARMESAVLQCEGDELTVGQLALPKI